MGHVLMENRNGLALDAALTRATGTAEREPALAMLDGWRGRRRGRRCVSPSENEQSYESRITIMRQFRRML
jgi:hypothetical protein